MPNILCNRIKKETSSWGSHMRKLHIRLPPESCRLALSGMLGPKMSFSCCGFVLSALFIHDFYKSFTYEGAPILR